MNIGRIVAGLAAVAIAMLLVVASVAPAAAHSGKKFGAILDKDTQPSNVSDGGRTCVLNDPKPCTWVMREAFRTPGARLHQAKAAKNGVLRKIRLIAAHPGSFRLQIAKIKPGTKKAKIVRNGPRITYEGQPEQPDPDSVGIAQDEYVIETFRVNVPIRKGQSLAVRAKRLSALRCTSGGQATLKFYDDPLKPGQRFRKAKATDGCFMLIRGIIR